MTATINPLTKSIRQSIGELPVVTDEYREFKIWLTQTHRREKSDPLLDHRLRELRKFRSLDSIWRLTDDYDLFRLLFYFFYESKTIWSQTKAPNVLPVVAGLMKKIEPFMGMKYPELFASLDELAKGDYLYKDVEDIRKCFIDDYRAHREIWNGRSEQSFASLQLAMKGHPFEAMQYFTNVLMKTREMGQTGNVQYQHAVKLADAIRLTMVCHMTHEYCKETQVMPDLNTDGDYGDLFNETRWQCQNDFISLCRKEFADLYSKF